MNKNLPTVAQNTQLVLTRSKNLIGITDKILANRSTALSEILLRQPYISFRHARHVSSVAFNSDRTKVLSGGTDKTLKLWDIESRKVIHTFEGHGDTVNSVAFSSDGTKVLSGSADNTLKLWDIENGKVIHTFEGHGDSVKSVVFSPDGTKVLSGSKDKTLKLWDIESGKVIHTFEEDNRWTCSVAFSPDGTKVLSGGDRTLKLWDIESGKELRNFEVDKWICIDSVAFSPDGTKFVSSNSRDNRLRLWDIESEKVIYTTVEWHGNVRSVAFSPDGTKVLSGGDKTLKLWDIESGKVIHTFEEDNRWVRSVAFSPDGTKVLSGGDKTLKLWDIESGKDIYTLYLSTTISLASNLETALAGNKLLNLKNNKIVKIFNEEVKAIQNNNITATTHSSRVEIYCSYSGQLTKSIDITYPLSGTLFQLELLALSQDNKMFILSKEWCERGDSARVYTLRVADTETGTGEEFYLHWNFVSMALFNSDGSKYLYRDTKSKRLVVQDLQTKRVISLKYQEDISSVAFSPDGTKVLTGSDQTLKLWDIENGKVIHTFEGHGNTVNSVAFSPDGTKVLSGSSDNTLKLWDIENGKVIHTLAVRGSDSSSVSFSPSGKAILFIEIDGSAKLFDTKTGKLIYTFFAFDDGEWVIITSDGYFDHSPNARKYLTVRTSVMSADEIDDATYAHYYRPNGFGQNKGVDSKKRLSEANANGRLF